MLNTDHQGYLMYRRGMPILVLKVLNLGKIVLVVGISKERKTLWRQKKNSKIG